MLPLLNVYRTPGTKTSALLIRREYDQFLGHARSRMKASQGARRFFITGQPRIGKWASYLLALGANASVFVISSDETVHYHGPNGAGWAAQIATQNPSEALLTTIGASWVLIDVEYRKYQPYVIWEKANADAWYMKTWTTKETAAVAELCGTDHVSVKARMQFLGPIARDIFPLRVRAFTEQDILEVLSQAVSGNLLEWKVPVETADDLPQILAVHCGIKCEPRINRETGELDRTQFRTSFLSDRLFELVAQSLQTRFEEVEAQMAGLLNVDASRGVVGKLVEGLMHKDLREGMLLPTGLGGHAIAHTLALIGNAEKFILQHVEPDDVALRPLYLRPRNENFAAIDAIVVVTDGLIFFQTSLSASHDRAFMVLLQILVHFPNATGIPVPKNLVYCLVGTDEERVRSLMHQATMTLSGLQALNCATLCENLGVKPATQIAYTRIGALKVDGYTFRIRHGFTKVEVV
ncbi:hypothetical protein B0H17DRAFT_1217541 [Mycena rosella]|uniref:Uncharacterized protein n=1 Tax=Mycena rosella TaxID=1033263 RepID=A0AAD7FPH4_MYCRO|nr:hypothetical protein B0H17DRAFT_1217541 [Mycena rosella]